MLKFVYTILIVAFIGEYSLVKLGAPSGVATIPLELLSGITVIVIIAIALSRKKITLHFKYILVIIFLLLLIIAGLIINQVQPGSIFYGIRAYFRYIPFFFLPAVYHFSNEQIKKIIRLIFFLILIQLPLIFYQRFIEFSHLLTGDVVTGTFKDPALVAIIAIAAIPFLITFYLRKEISLKLLLISIPLLVLPAALNETKSVLFFLPIALIAPIFFIEDRRKKLKEIFPVFIFGFLFIVIFVAVYNIHYGKRWDGNIVNMLFSEDRIEGYLHKGATTKSDGTEKNTIGRVDSITLPFQVFSNQPIKYLFGVGIGNAISKPTSKLTAGKYSYKYIKHGGRMSTASQLIWEIGIVGFLIFMLIMFMIFRDCLALRYGNRVENNIALASAAVFPIIVITLFYKNSIAIQQPSVCFLFLSGYIASQNYRRIKNIK